MRRRYNNHTNVDKDIPEIAQLWICRVLVHLGMHKKFIEKTRLDNDSLAFAIGMSEWVDKNSDDYNAIECLSELKRIHASLERKVKKITLPKSLATNIAHLTKLVGLNDTEGTVLAFAVMLDTISPIETVTDYLGNLTTIKMCRSLSVILDRPENEIKEALSMQGILHRSGLLTIDRQCQSMDYKIDLLTNTFADTLISTIASPNDYLKGVVTPSSAPELSMDDYEHIQPFIDILQPYFSHTLKTARRGVNILIHGAPGTGKSQFVKAFSHSLGCELFDIANEDNEGDSVNGERRLRAYSLAQNFFAKRRAILFFDEVEDVFASENPFFGKKSPAQSRKGWMNKILEENPVPAFWVSNAIGQIDPAFIRRFDMVFELPIPPKNQRTKIIEQNCSGLIAAETITRIAESEKLSPAVVARACAVIDSIKGEMPQDELTASFERLINNTLKAQHHAPIPKHKASELPAYYDATLTNADIDLIAIADGIKHADAGRLCLYGPAGTGKTAYGRWLAEYLGKSLILEKVSDLQSMYVGETEQNIARAFERAQEAGAVLMIDEVDSFLQDRRNATRSWETTQVNEMLTQIESYSGVLIVSTNLMDNIDPASLRRFDLKAKFDYLKPEQAVTLLSRCAEQLKLHAPTERENRDIQQLRTLTPGDFATIMRQNRFRPMSSVAEIIGALQAECSLKPSTGKAIGFY